MRNKKAASSLNPFVLLQRVPPMALFLKSHGCRSNPVQAHRSSSQWGLLIETALRKAKRPVPQSPDGVGWRLVFSLALFFKLLLLFSLLVSSPVN